MPAWHKNLDESGCWQSHRNRKGCSTDKDLERHAMTGRQGFWSDEVRCSGLPFHFLRGPHSLRWSSVRWIAPHLPHICLISLQYTEWASVPSTKCSLSNTQLVDLRFTTEKNSSRRWQKEHQVRNVWTSEFYFGFSHQHDKDQMIQIF